jgi:chromosome segregation ATPase
MSASGQFANLRLNGQEGQSQERFWPSFTTIMMVIAMVFLLALVVMLMRNMELVGQLRTTMEAERLAAELARTTGEEKEVLAIKLNDAESQLAALRLQLMRQEEERGHQDSAITSQTSQIKEQQQLIDKLSEERDLLSLKKGQLEDQFARMKDELKIANAQVARLEKEEVRLARSESQLRKELAKMEQQWESAQSTSTDLQQHQDQMAKELSEARKRSDAVQKELDNLRRSSSRQAEELAGFRGQAHQSGRELNALRNDHEQLQLKYNKLIKPTRSPLGKQVIEVRYSKVKGEYRIEYKDAQQTKFKRVTQEELEGHLMALKAEHPNGLYIKVTLPEKSGLTYSEAWSFTSDLHKRYDYYYQTGVKPVSEVPKPEADVPAAK